MSGLEDIADRAINYTNGILNKMPSYRTNAVAGLRKLRAALAAQTPHDAAVEKLDAYLNALDGDARQDESSLTRQNSLL